MPESAMHTRVAHVHKDLFTNDPTAQNEAVPYEGAWTALGQRAWVSPLQPAHRNHDIRPDTVPRKAQGGKAEVGCRRGGRCPQLPWTQPAWPLRLG